MMLMKPTNSAGPVLYADPATRCSIKAVFLPNYNVTRAERLSLAAKYSEQFFFSSRRRHTRFDCDWSSDVCSSDLIHAEGYPAAEMKHGPIALIDDLMPVVFIAPKDAVYQKVVSNVEEVKARGGRVLAVVTEGDSGLAKLADHKIEVPETLDLLTPVLTVLPLQLLAYYIAVRRGCNVDQPRNLAKSVTVE